FEAEISMEELQSMLFEELELPYMEQKQKDNLQTQEIQFNDIRKKGIMSNIDKKRTILENLRRNAGSGSPGIHHISPDDLRFKTWDEVVVPHSNALILAMMDTSGSMGSFEKYIARSFFFWMTRFLRTKYEKVEIVFIAHHTEAKEVSEEEFFTKGESGGTICSSAYQKALEIIDRRYPSSHYNIYPFHFSDGDNLTSDNERCVKLIEKLLERSNMFGYGEVNQYNRSSTLMSAYRHIQYPRFQHCVIREKGEVYKALKTFFTKGKEG
ncbi:MAG: stress response protein, partial [Paenibacillus sp.]|nr:stress response protein [Paenibacillus sp.]